MKYYTMFLFLFIGCGQEPCYINLYQNVTNYSINPDAWTDQGIAVDTGDQPINMEQLSNSISKIESCLEELYIRNYKPNQEAQCLQNGIRPTPLNTCIRIKIMEPVLSECSEWHFLKEKAPQELCAAKGLEETNLCPCRWRWAIQNDSDLITPPGHLGKPYLYDLVRIHTGCNNPWADKELVRCMRLGE